MENWEEQLKELKERPKNMLRKQKKPKWWDVLNSHQLGLPVGPGLHKTFPVWAQKIPYPRKLLSVRQTRMAGHPMTRRVVGQS